MAATTATATEPRTWRQLQALLRERDHDPSYGDAPVLDAYARISTSPDGDLEKTDRQLFDILRSVQGRRARLGEVLRDDNISAWSRNAKRPGWNRLVQRLEDGHASGVVAWHTDRLMRQPRDLERLVDLGDRGVLVWSCYGDYDLTKADDRFTLRVLTAAAEKDSASTSRRQKRKAAALREQGRRNGGPRPFGMPQLAKRGLPVEPHQLQAEREAIAWAVRAHLDELSLHAIAAEWNARGLRTRTGRRWDARQLHIVLCAPHIAGLLAYKGKPLAMPLKDANGNIVEPIVSREDWEAIVATFKSRRRGRPITNEYLLSGGHLVCGREGCGQPLTGKVDSGRPHPDGSPRRRYVCRGRDGACGRLSIDATRVETAVRDKVIETLSNPEHAEQVARASEKLAEVEGRLAKEKKKRANLARRLAEDELDEDEWQVARGALTRRIEKLSAEREALRDAGAGEAASAESAAKIAAQWDQATSIEAKRALVHKAFPRGIAVLPATPVQKSTHTDVAERLRVR